MNAIQAYPTEYPRCPKCNNLLRRMTVSNGVVWRTCENKAPDPRPEADGRLRACGQTSIVAAFQGVAFVAPVPKHVFLEHQTCYPGLRRIYHEADIGFIPSDLESPSFACSRCHDPTPVVDLVFGLCTKCARAAERDAAG